jgi:hypothetical protein
MASKRRKHVLQEALTGLPEPEEGEVVAQVVGSRGSNMMEVSNTAVERGSESKRYTWLCVIPSRFRKKLWMKRGTNKRSNGAAVQGVGFLVPSSCSSLFLG